MNIEIFQIYFRPDQLRLLDPAFTPYDNSGSTNADYREFYVFRKEYSEGKILPDRYVGYVSWKFQQKTKISGKGFIDFCKGNPGYDVYFVNPFPIFVSYGNVWKTGELFHPGLGEITNRIFRALNIPVKLSEVPNTLQLTSYCNFWVGNKTFWDSYMAFCMPIVEYIETRMPESEKRELFSLASDASGASYFAYIVERLFTTFLALHPEIKALSFPLSEADLKQQYGPTEITILGRLKSLESEYPQSTNPLSEDTTFSDACRFYWRGRLNPRSLNNRLMRAVEKAWNATPFRRTLKQMPGFRLMSQLIIKTLSRGPRVS